MTDSNLFSPKPNQIVSTTEASERADSLGTSAESGALRSDSSTSPGGVGRRSPLDLLSSGRNGYPSTELEPVQDEEHLGAALDQALNYELRIMAGNSNRELAAAIARNLKIELMEADVRRFSDGEIYVSIKENVRGKDVFVVQGTSPPVNDNIMELLLMIDTLKRASAKRITAVMPYFGYGRQDRKCAPRVPISARLMADLLEVSGAHRVLAFELHAGQIQGFFRIPVDHMYAVPVFVSYLLENNFDGLVDPVIVSPDAGGMERARAFAKRLNASLAIIDKRRSGPNVAHVMHIIGEVHERDCIIIDDMVDTAGTLTEAAKALKDHGAKKVHAYAVHPVLSGPALDRIRESAIDKVVVTNSIIVSDERKRKSGNKIVQLPVDILFSDCIKRIHREQSVSSLFDQ
ncbi:probable phosphoribosyl diphosphate synthetase; ribose-phosphate pyrophosphokinase [Cyanidioschyzon merolae strain 10D]|jgi:ribose-phosphate pyrophosphokinase|uniref:ribose-phosphate diphosphokinase n=1 Tax=Cyanidioschyzon merolae (strain NIES-3377 / 10D) TaxID=280699 RepID=M1V7I2_CYAM1|nr:probable phosphoribosyl diphosphate synthetase; ribose-phosphate pyrophosphokinase [Cyanidioschyzon merolae strain 10D]BAM83125.1 probable phosphoribosyl diphosphate synthetase; ribose-phosphate pyrophosphokinase [Cyanidioschyzon merolae strain 10D]|eukprot:XP_005539161.1 probable phosphoribosyl diphosphate synthetase; ribose-phosphate pyrophosphokinase [Cyanidioschyzon merolae strain 10D]